MDNRNNDAIRTDGAGEPLRVGVYICKCGGNISDVIDVDRVAAEARNLPGVVVARVHMFMCSDPGQLSIENDVRDEKLNRVVVASCSPFLHETTFRHAVERASLNPYLYEHVNIREQGSWAHKHDPVGATEKAVRLIAAAVGKLSRSKALEPIHLPNHRRVVIIGGGVAGMRAAADLGRRGIDVVLIEKSSRLGGWCNELGSVFESDRPARELVGALERQVRESEKVEVLLETEVTDVSGSVGNFKVAVAGPLGPGGKADTARIDAGVIIVATGFEPYQPHQGEYAFGRHAAVVTMPEFIKLMDSQPDKSGRLIHAGKAIGSVAFIHCVGSRQVDGVQEPQADGKVNEYCSRVCCTTTIHQMLSLRERFPGTLAMDLHQDIRTYGPGHEEYYERASRAGVTFFRWQAEQPPNVEVVQDASSSEPLEVTVTDYLTWGEELKIPVDMVVLAVGMMPGRIKSLLDILKLPVGDDRFCQEVHPKLQPVESSVKGVLLAGTAQGPKSIVESLQSASAAAVTASIMLSTDQVQLNPYVAAVAPDRCEGLGLCVGQCDYDALTLIETQANGRVVLRAHVNPGLCVGCGACVAVCPVRAIQVQGWTLDQYESMVDGLAGLAPTEAASAEANLVGE